MRWENCHYINYYQEYPNYSPGVKFGPSLGVTSFNWACIGKTLEISRVPSHEASANQILHVALSSGPLRRMPQLLAPPKGS